MPGRDPVEVTVEVEGRELVAGTLWIHERGGQAATFRYADSYLASPDSYELDPVLPKAAGAFHTQAGRAMFNAFADSAPDRWGENLMRRAERERARLAAAAPTTLGKADFLLGVRDDTRQGAVRFREPVPTLTTQRTRMRYRGSLSFPVCCEQSIVSTRKAPWTVTSKI
ncbi:MAG TPA: HipA N-terminal domain-containing protein [Trebonia sp.]|nr:HipA N-terminal domain-containing protein [Trebonia sp.]